jgi:hypothetical protein
MREFTFQATLLASIRVKAETRAEAEQKLRVALAASEFEYGDAATTAPHQGSSQNLPKILR